MNRRGIEPGSIDTNYVPTKGAQSPEANRRGMVPGPDGREQPEVTAAREAAEKAAQEVAAREATERALVAAPKMPPQARREVRR